MTKKFLLAAAACAAGLILSVPPVAATTYTVTTLADSGAGSLRTLAASPNGSTIVFSSTLSGGTITLTSGEIALNTSVTIDASALPAGITLSGGGASRIFNLGSGATVTLNALTITRGSTPDTGGAIYSAPGTSLTMTRCTVTGSTGLEGGAMLNDGTLLMQNCTLTGNTAIGGYGGALQCRFTTTLNHCTFSGNNAVYGGAIYNKLYTLTVQDCIVAGNTAGALGNDIYSQNATLIFANTNNVQNYYNDNSGSSGPAPLTGAPLLLPLGNYGGPTQTMPPGFGSPDIDAGGSTTLTTDQRGFPRVVGPAPDLGAVELQDAEPFYSLVQTVADLGPWTLRGAIAGATNNELITFAPSLSGQTITLTSTELEVTTNVTILGLGATNLAVSGNNGRRVFNVNYGASLNVSGMTIRNGRTPNAGGYGQPAANGGGIVNSGTLNMTNCVVTACGTGNGSDGYPPANPSPTPTTPGGAGGYGGGIYNAATLRMYGCTISGNACGSGGYGGIGNWSTNTGGNGGQGGNGGGIVSYGTAVLFNCTIGGNSAGSGGGGGNAPVGQGGNPGASGGSGGNGGGGGGIAALNGSLSLTSCTISGNSAGSAGPASFEGGSSGANGGGGGVMDQSVTIPCDNVIIAGNSAAGSPDVANTFNSLGHNLIGRVDGIYGFPSSSDIIGSVAAPVNAVLGPLQLNGGQTPTFALLPGSPAIEYGDDSLAGTDQRGFPRPNGAHVDIGAYELDISSFPPLSVTPLGQNIGAPDAIFGKVPVTFNTAINPGGLVTVATVQYGLTTSYGAATNLTFPSFGVANLNLSALVSGFAPGVVYHYRIAATNPDFSVASPDQVFQPPAPYKAGDLNGDGVVSQSELSQVYSNYLATSPWLSMTNTAGLGGANVTFQLTNQIAGGYSVQYSTDLVNWVYLGPANPFYAFEDTNALATPVRYYRLSYP